MAPESRGSRTRRLFFALWPADALRIEVARIAGQCIASRGGRAVREGNLHLTVLFLGQVPEHRLADVLTAAAHVRGAPFDAAFDQLEVWPKSNVLCLTPSAAPEALLALHSALRTEAAAVGFSFQEQTFRPHVTLARDVPRSRRSRQPTAPLRWSVSEYVLVESNMTKTGSEYVVIARWPLASAS